jgi:hypothetical protein
MQIFDKRLVIFFFCEAVRKKFANTSKRVNLKKNDMRYYKSHVISYHILPFPIRELFYIYSLLWLDVSMEIALTDKIFIAMQTMIMTSSNGHPGEDQGNTGADT